jgi:hypothetical protein
MSPKLYTRGCSSSFVNTGLPCFSRRYMMIRKTTAAIKSAAKTMIKAVPQIGIFPSSSASEN